MTKQLIISLKEMWKVCAVLPEYSSCSTRMKPSGKISFKVAVLGASKMAMESKTEGNLTLSHT